jgi:Endonuclease/Exonuclease/phosphatase family
MRRVLDLSAAFAAVLVAVAPASADARAPDRAPVRFATFNASLNRGAPGALTADLRRALDNDPTNDSAQLRAVLDIVAINDPDVLLINEFDTGTDGDAATVAMFAQLAGYPYFFTDASNTGIPSGFDLNNNDVIGGGDDALGFGAFPGQFGLAVFSKFPIDVGGARTFQHFLWKDMPGALLPIDPRTGEPWYLPEELDILPLSSKSHWDVPIEIGGTTVHFLVSHPTPPVFDGDEDRNGTRNFDEIGFWADYVQPGVRSRYIYDDRGTTGGLRPGAAFVIAGDQNSDPLDGDSIPGAIQQLLDHPRVNDRDAPSSAGAVEAAELQGGANLTHRSDPQFDTADFADGAPGNLRADYVLPSKRLHIVDSAVFWPEQGEPGSELTGVFPFPSSDHRLVWVDVRT